MITKLMYPPVNTPLSISRFAFEALNLTKPQFDVKPMYWLDQLRQMGLVITENRELQKLRYVIEDPYHIIPYEPPKDNELKGCDLREVEEYFRAYKEKHTYMGIRKMVEEYARAHRDHKQLGVELMWLRDEGQLTDVVGYDWVVWDGMKYNKINGEQEEWLEDKMRGVGVERMVDFVAMGGLRREQVEVMVRKVMGEFDRRWGVRVERVGRLR